MSKHSTSALTMRDALYEAPGPKMRAKIRMVFLYAPHHLEVLACRL